jgi:S-DNA-T family DNA segregation ATPase FtsK/SpoIIIE
MASRSQKQATAASKPPPSGGRRFLRYGFVLMFAGAAVLAWISLLTFSPTDPPSCEVYPPKGAADNAAGMAGAYTAHALRYWLGSGAYVGLLFASLAAVLMVLGGRITDVPWRIVGVVLLIAAAGATAFLLDPTSHAGPARSMAGVFGRALGYFVLTSFGSTGAWIVLLVVYAIGVMFAADELVKCLPKLGRKALGRRGKTQSITAIVRRRLPRTSAADSAAAAAAKAIASASPLSDEGSAEQRGLYRGAAAHGPRLIPPAKKVTARQAAPRSRPAEDRRSDDAKFVLPSVDLLLDPSGSYIESQEAHAAQKRDILQQTLDNFQVEAKVIAHQTGPVITLFEVAVAPGVKVSQVSNLANDIARALAVPGVRVVSPLPGKDTLGIEVPNLDKEIVRIKELMNLAPEAERQLGLPLYLGKDAGGDPIVADLSGMPHILLAGTTGSGKSVSINAIITSLLMTRTPEQVGLILVDPKMVEMAAFESVPHLLCPIVNDMRRAEAILEWAATKMDERYELLKEARVRNVAEYNRLGKEELYDRFGATDEQERERIPLRLPYYIIVIDELADLMMISSKEVELYVIRIAQKARAVGIHLVLATQRPSVNVVTGLIKSNMPCRISFRVASRQESRIVLDQNGAEVLLGRGDMLFLQPGTSNLIRAQGTFVEDSEIRAVVRQLRKCGTQHFNSELMRLNSRPAGQEGSGERDELFDKAAEIALMVGRGSVTLLQRKLQIGYGRAARIIEQMAEAGIVGAHKGSQARECLMTLEEWQELQSAVPAGLGEEPAADGGASP